MATYPDNFLSANYANSKRPNVVFVIDGVATSFTLSQANRFYPVYGDPIDYGDPGLFYGEPYRVGNTKSLIATDSNLTISQKIEPEQGRGSTSEITVVLIDKNQEVSKLIAPGQVVPDILGRECTLFLGYENTNYPDDYFVIFRGHITNTVAQAGKIRLTVSDATQKKRQGAFYAYRASTYTPIRAGGDITVSTYTGLFDDVTNVNGVYDSTITRYLKIADEFCKLTPPTPNQNPDTTSLNAPFYNTITVDRGVRGTTPQSYGAIKLQNPISENVTFTASTNIVTLNNHRLQNGQVVGFSQILNQTGDSSNPSLLTSELYYVRNRTANTFQLSYTPTGAIIPIITSTSGTIEREWLDLTVNIASVNYTINVCVSQFEYDLPLLADVLTVNMNKAAVAAGAPAEILSAQLYRSREGDPLNGFYNYEMTFTDTTPNQYRWVISTKNGPFFSSGQPLSLLFGSGANAANSLADTLGFLQLDKTGSVQYEGDKYLSVDAKDISTALEIIDHPMNVALSVMLSGWGGPFISDQTCRGVGTADGTTLSGNSILLGFDTDAKRDYGLTSGLSSSTNVTKLGDMVTISGSTVNNNRDWIITDIQPGPDGTNQRLLVSPRTGGGSLDLDTGSSVRLAFRSKYDRLPKDYGLKLAPKFVDVEGHEFLRDVYLADSGYIIAPLIQNQQAGKEFIESQCYFPIGCYSATRLGRLSVTLTKPPLAGVDTVQLDASNILNPQNITVTRGLNNRRFFNQVQYQYDRTDAGKYLSVYRGIDTESLNTIGLQSILPVNSDGIKTTINGAETGAASIVEGVSNAFLQRFADVAFEIRLTVNLEAGTRIEAGDTVRLVDDGSLGITNLADGTRTLGATLLEVIDRSLDVRNGTCSLTLLSSVGYLASDRFGIISPTSEVDTSGASPAPSTTSFAVLPSFGAVFGDAEYKKWTPFVGQNVVVYSQDWSVYESRAIASVAASDLTNPYGRITLATALSFTPSAKYFVQLADYNAGTNPALDAYAKLTHAFLDPTVTVTASSNELSFFVSLSDVAKFKEEAVIYVHTVDYAQKSPNVKVTAVNAGTGRITVNTALGYTPQAGDLVELIGFPDGGAGYMWS